MKITVRRRFFKPIYTIGTMYVNGERFCDTLEDPVRDLKDMNHDNDFDDPGEGKIYGETAIPYGTFRVIVNYSPKLKRRLPLLEKVPGFSGIRIHRGTNAGHTEGCILIGENKAMGKLINGPYYEIKLIDLIDFAINNGEKVELTITA